MNVQQHPVLIVGAGPSGMTLALQLARYNVPLRIIDKHAEPLQLSKAAAIHARTLEIFADLGVIDTFLAEGQQVDILALRTRYKDRLRLDFSRLKHTPYPFMLDLPQYRTEYILMKKLEEINIPVERGVQLVGMQQNADAVEARLRHADGREEQVSVSWLIGADGAKSTVRTLAGIDFVGEAYADDWVLCDAKISWPLPRNEMTFSGDREGIFGVFPLPGENTYRMAYTQTRDRAGRLVEPDREDAQHSLERTGIDGKVLAAEQFWTFNLAHRQVTDSRQGRIFLIGDAAHIHTPFGGQGMNLGIADAYNLGWKLAYVFHGDAHDGLLDSYQRERASVIKGVIRTTHLGVTAMLMKEGRQAAARDLLMQAVGSSYILPKFLTFSFSQLAHHYRHSPIVKGHALRLQAGDRAPDQRFFDGITQSYQHLFELIKGTQHTLLLFIGEKQNQRAALLQLLTESARRYPGILDIRVIGTSYQRPDWLPEDVQYWSDRGRDLSLYHQFGITTAYLVRPDKYLGFIQPNPGWSELDHYLQQILTGSTR
ncbi:hypothetical protein KDA_70210 [Dictyobacter alpinus]|uniref:FAD-binding domain-containing protein n=1 Tax=Dictyobacter alpinus TaxID=2014873 RepID=A0A402BJL2_9CHLR|nr:FAD-dependent monooxygenase [Dictyobacter alpinus]GCE31537.1 hypothetical protein KDA_70210 [Dictyobacter alpinus]